MHGLTHDFGVALDGVHSSLHSVLIDVEFVGSVNADFFEVLLLFLYIFPEFLSLHLHLSFLLLLDFLSS